MPGAPKKRITGKNVKPTVAKEKVHRMYLYGFNLHLFTEKKRDADSYKRLFEEIFNRNISPDLTSDKAMTLRTQDIVTIGSRKGEEMQIMKGELVRFTKLTTSGWYNETTKQIQTQVVPEGLNPNSYSTDYFFVPAAHRFYFRYTSKISAPAVEMFLSKALNSVLDTYDNVKVNLIQSKDSIAEIIGATKLTELEVSINYTNDDIGDMNKEFLESLLKDANSGETDMTFKPDATGQLNTDNQLIRGALELAQENGEATAKITNAQGKKETIRTRNYPAKIPVTYKENEVPAVVLLKDVMEEYRNVKHNDEPNKPDDAAAGE